MIKKLEFFRNSFFPKKFLWTCRMQLTTLPKNCRQKAGKNLLNVQNRQEKYNFSETYFYSNCSYGHEKCSFEKPAEKFLPKGRKIFSRSPKMVRKKYNFLKIFFSQNVSLDT